MTSPATSSRIKFGAVSQERAAAATSYDFRKPIKLSREHTRLLQLTYDAYARQATTIFTSALRAVSSVVLRDVTQVSYAEYVASLGQQTYMTLFTQEPLAGRGVLEFPIEAAMVCIDHMLGGKGTGRQPQRPLSELEATVIRSLIDRLLSDLGYTFADIVRINPSAVGVEYSPQFAQVASSSDVMVVARFDLEIGHFHHELSLCLPFSELQVHLNRAVEPSPVSLAEQEKKADAALRLLAGVDDVPVPVSVRLRPALVDSYALSNIKVGSVIALSHPSAAPWEVSVEDAVFGYASAGASGNKVAVQILETTQEINP